MTIKIPTTREVTIHTVLIDVPVQYDEEDIPNNFPLRVNSPTGDRWVAEVEIDTGRILDWPAGAPSECHMHMKVCDSGRYTLYDEERKAVADRYDYVPHGIIPGESGDYVVFHIKDGVITNWPKKPDVSDIIRGYFNQDED